MYRRKDGFNPFLRDNGFVPRRPGGGYNGEKKKDEALARLVPFACQMISMRYVFVLRQDSRRSARSGSFSNNWAVFFFVGPGVMLTYGRLVPELNCFIDCVEAPFPPLPFFFQCRCRSGEANPQHHLFLFLVARLMYISMCRNVLRRFYVGTSSGSNYVQNPIKSCQPIKSFCNIAPDFSRTIPRQRAHAQ